ncbi:MAG: hypothetical protein JST80_02075 [Bdellovibrionales bacterium]|nr:hypothetical protein [Bdellovibrionales bacterium]
MKTINNILLALLAVGLTACGNNNNNPYPNGQGYYGNQTGYYGATQGGCVPLTSGAFGFTATNAQMNSAIILAGTLPANSTSPGAHGTVAMGSAGATQGLIQYQPKQSQYGTLQIAIAPQGGVMTGVVQLQPQVLYSLTGYNYGYGAYPNQQSQLCVQSMSFDIVHTLQMSQAGYGGYTQGYGYINQALVYLTLNNGQTIGPIPFY